MITELQAAVGTSEIPAEVEAEVLRLAWVILDNFLKGLTEPCLQCPAVGSYCQVGGFRYLTVTRGTVHFSTWLM